MQIKCSRCTGSGQIRGAMQKLIACDCCGGKGFTEMEEQVIHKVVNGKVQRTVEEITKDIKAELSKAATAKEEKSKAIREGIAKSKAKRSIEEITRDAEKEAGNFLDSISTDDE